MQIEIEIDIFSGRPNPRWALSAGNAVELTNRLKSTLPTIDGPQPQPRLGYRGFVLYRADANGTVRPWLRVFKGTISDLMGEDLHSYHDIVALEDWLIELAGEAGFGALLNTVNKT